MGKDVVVVGAGLIGQAIARRVAAGKQVLLADVRRENADAAAQVLADAGFEVSTAVVDVSSRESVHALVETATGLGEVTGVIHAAGVSASQATIEQILQVDLYGTALVLEEFGNVIAEGGAGVVISSQSGHRYPALTVEEDRLLATTPVDELNGVNAAGYRRMLELAPAGRAGTPDEIGTVGELLMTERGAFITGSDILIDGGGTASYFYGPLAGLAPTPKDATRD